MNLNERQIIAVLYVKEHGEINNSKYQKINNVGRTASTEELHDLANKDIFTRLGKPGRGIKYFLSNVIDHQ